jgi:hypothetical protein
VSEVEEGLLYDELSQNPSIAWEIAQDKEWNYGELSGNSNITWEIIQANPDIEWDYRVISKSQHHLGDCPDQPKQKLSLCWTQSLTLSRLIILTKNGTF